MRKKIRIGISACLLGEKVRYDSGDKRADFLIAAIEQYVEWEPVCPETECGLQAPREQMRLEGDPHSPRLVTILTKIDHTNSMHEWAEKKIREIQFTDLCGFVLKSRSPSCGIQGIMVYDPSGAPISAGRGIFAAALTDRLPALPIEDEERLMDASLREHFIERLFSYRKWKGHASR